MDKRILWSALKVDSYEIPMFGSGVENRLGDYEDDKKMLIHSAFQYSSFSFRILLSSSFTITPWSSRVHLIIFHLKEILVGARSIKIDIKKGGTSEIC